SELAVGRDLNGNGRSTDALPEYAEFPLWIGRTVPLPRFQKHFITEDFWATFASWPVAVPFLLVCGFAAVYFLGAKAYCSYGCPYGAFFAPIDRLSPFRIRVNDNCAGCGHCTAVCTSNVRVHEEVRDYGAVVDPGCMKCLDCISVCPTDALRVGLGAPAILTGPRDPDSPMLLRARQQAARRYDLTLGEEIALGVVFLLLFIGYRGMYGLVPLLMAMGIAMVVTFLIFKAWRALRDANVRAPFWQIKRDGRLRPAGWLFLLATGLFTAVGVQGLAIKTAYWRADALAARLQRTDEAWAAAGKPYKPTTADLVDARAATAGMTFASGIGEGGIGFITSPAQHERLSFLYAYVGDNPHAEEHLLKLMRAKEPGPQWLGALNGFFQVRDAPASERQAILESLAARWPDNNHLREALAIEHIRQGRVDAALALYDARLAKAPADQPAVYSAAVLRIQINPPRADEALALVRKALTDAPDSPMLNEALARVLLARNDLSGAITALRAAADKEPTPQRWRVLADLYRASGNAPEAAAAQQRASDLLTGGLRGTPAPQGGTTAPLEAVPSATR
ncbi:MAG: tetratricopeptide repeat protein, partial [Phycisphaerales bacterium]|nr:tetratricopeptide repeat protein [Phycisphaerales bacterium]